MIKQIQIVMLLFVTLTQAQHNKTTLAPVNDELPGAIDIQNGNVIGNYPVNGTNINATVTVVPVSGCDMLRKDTWFSVLIPPSGNLTIETSQADSNSIYDTVMSVYSGSLSSLTLIDCNDDLDGLSGFSRVTVSGRSEGEKLYVSVWRFADATFGDFKVSAFDASILNTATNAIEPFSIFPNPVASILNFSGIVDETEVTLYNVLGQKTKSFKITAAQPVINISDLETGTYYLKLSSENATAMLKLMKI